MGTFSSPRDKFVGDLVSEADPDFEKKASPMELSAVKSARKASGKSQEELERAIGVEGEIKADFKIEVHFGPKRTINGPNLLGLKVWLSGKKFHGGGDEICFWCSDTSGTGAGCGNIILPDIIKGGIAYCEVCKRGVVADRLADMIVHRISTRNLSKLVEKLFRKLHSKADIYCKYDPDDIRYKVVVEKMGSLEAHKNRGRLIYPLKNIIRDTSNGASLENRLFALFSA